jgi:hypothetical protein
MIHRNFPFLSQKLHTIGANIIFRCFVLSPFFVHFFQCFVLFLFFVHFFSVLCRVDFSSIFSVFCVVSVFFSVLCRLHFSSTFFIRQQKFREAELLRNGSYDAVSLTFWFPVLQNWKKCQLSYFWISPPSSRLQSNFLDKNAGSKYW